MVESCRVLLYCKFTNIIGSVKVDHDWPRFRECWSQKEKNNYQSNLHKDGFIVAHFTVCKNVVKAPPDHSYSIVPA